MAFFEAVKKDFNLKKIQQRVDPLLFDNSKGDPEFVLITEKPYLKAAVNQLLRSFATILRRKPRVIILSSIVIEPTEKDLQKQITELYTSYRSDFKELVPRGAKILVEGRAIYALTRGNTLDVSSFYDIVFNKSHFFFPETRSKVFPIDTFYKWREKDNWENHFTKLQLIKVIKEEKASPRLPKLTKIKIEKDEIAKFFEEKSLEPRIAIDTETSGFDFLVDRVGCVTLSFDGKTGYYINWDYIDPDEFGHFIRGKYQIYANGKFDIKMLMSHKVPRDSMHIDSDIVNLAHLVNEMSFNGLKVSAWTHTSFGGYQEAQDTYYKKNKLKSYLDIPEDILVEYSVMDAILTFQIHEKMLAQVKEIDIKFPMKTKFTLESYYFDVVVPTLNAFIDIEFEGVYIDTAKLQEASTLLEKEIIFAKDQVLKALDTTINVDSPAQLGKLFEQKGWREIQRGKSGNYLTNVDCLAEWAKEGHTEASQILEYRKLTTIQNTFVGYEKKNSGYWQYLKKHKDGSNRVHSSFAIMLAGSGRNKSKKPNLQNVPARGKAAELVRSFFVPPNKDYVFLSADASGLQLRLAAMVNNDTLMREIFTELSGDMHSISAQSVILNHKVPLAEFLKEKKGKYKPVRAKAKTLNFGLLFGASASTVAEKTIKPNWTKAECEQYISENKLFPLPWQQDQNDIFFIVAYDLRKKFMTTYKGLSAYLDASRKLAEKQGYIRSPFGAIRRLPQLLYQGDKDDRDNRGISNLLNICLNSPIQNMESVYMHRMVIEVSKFIKENNMKSRFFGAIHDAVELYAHKDEVLILKEKITESFTRVVPESNGIPLEMEGNVADFYGEGELWDMGKEW